MLTLKNIKKEYKVADSKVLALKGINLSFRKNEFVSILGPSGCGKTTTLNIIGGLDKYSSGDLIINGKSTKEYSDKDWDIYRNHRVGFIFQSYNLIPHQTILGNVELALTIAGIQQNERIERAKKALDQVGLSGQYYKKPNQLSGGQCQRVAIARALVNEPEILLADEPTGALDTETSIQIMDLIKNISKDKLVIMVTHNPDLANKYSTRIINLLDGEVVSDTNPYQEEKEEIKEIKDEKAKMSWWTSFKLSFKNLLSKKGRSILVSIAGSIGIIGVASVLSVSTGINGYITDMQDDMLSGYPIQISENAYDLSTIMSLMSDSDKARLTKKIISGEVNVDYVLDEILSTVTKSSSFSISNDLSPEYLEFIKKMPSSFYSDVSYKYGYDLSNNIYTGFVKHGEDEKLYSLNSIVDNYQSVLSNVEGIGAYSSYITTLVNGISQLPAHNSYIETQYEKLYGQLPTNENELLLVLDNNETVSDLLLAQLGYMTQDEFVQLANNSRNIAANVENYNHDLDPHSFSYEKIVGHDIYYAPNSAIYEFKEMIDYDDVKIPSFTYHNVLTDTSKATKLTIKGIYKAKDGIKYGSLKPGLYYTEDLAKKMNTDTLNDVATTLNGGGFTFSALVASSKTIMNSKSLKICTYNYSYYNYATGEEVLDQVGYIGQANEIATYLGAMDTSGTLASALASKTITSRAIGFESRPSSINIYPKSFDEKNKVTDYLDQWNDKDYVFSYETNLGNTLTIDYENRKNVTYTDNVGVIINMLRTFINIVTSALIAFTALALVVSCFMIAIITYVSVMERVKEIGVIRSLGGRKKDVSHLFNAETFMLGLSSGIIGIIITYVITLILNLTVGKMAGANIAQLYWYQALLMIFVSVLLTVLSGAFPAKSAAKQDPVNALRSE